VVADLKADDPAVGPRRILHDIREIAVYGQEQTIELLRLLDDRRIL